jgi:MinD superfamily P-loop ATPase
MKVVIASGKGGTGKTLIATNLAWMIGELNVDTTYVDADVEAPNGHLFLRPTGVSTSRFASPLPTLKESTCSGCGECQRFCAFHAIIATTDKVLVFPELCHSCGGCLDACPDNALVERPRESGTLLRGESGRIHFRSGSLDVGEPRSTPIIETLIADTPDIGVVVVDSPPGTSCSAVATMKGADQVVLVTEPTPFGLHDLQLAVDLCRKLGCRPSVIVNRCDLGGTQVQRYLETESIPVLAEIPFDRTLSDLYARAELAAPTHEPLRQALRQVISTLLLESIGGKAA